MRLIDADKLKNEFKKSKGLISNFAVEMVDLSPTIDAAPVIHAMWRPNNDGTEFMCSCCDNVEISKTPYCCYCGSKMDL